MSKGRFSPKVAALIWARDEGACVICGVGLWWEDRGNSWSIHHRCPRGMGGSRAPWVGQAANGLVLCGTGTTGCHGDVETNRDTAYAKGWLVRRNGVLRPAAVPVEYRGDRLFFLSNTGERIEIDTTPI